MSTAPTQNTPPANDLDRMASEAMKSLEGWMAPLEERLRALLSTTADVPNLREGDYYSLGLDEANAERGKRLRPALCLATAKALGVDPLRAMPFACAIELMHNFALVHDDIEDGDEVRRNRPSTWRRYGIAHAINIGDDLLALVYESLLADMTPADPPLQLRLSRLMTETLRRTIAGQAMDMNARERHDMNEGDYLQVVRAKTGHYLAAPMLGGAVVADREDLMPELRAYGDAMGPLFQIKDDVLDLTAGKGRGGSLGNDIREGKRSYLVAVTTARASEPDRLRLYAILDRPRQETTDHEIEEAIALFERYGALKEAEATCDRLLREGLRATESLPEELRKLLAGTAVYLAQRSR